MAIPYTGIRLGLYSKCTKEDKCCADKDLCMICKESDEIMPVTYFKTGENMGEKKPRFDIGLDDNCGTHLSNEGTE